MDHISHLSLLLLLICGWKFWNSEHSTSSWPSALQILKWKILAACLHCYYAAHSVCLTGTQGILCWGYSIVGMYMYHFSLSLLNGLNRSPNWTPNLHDWLQKVEIVIVLRSCDFAHSILMWTWSWHYHCSWPWVKCNVSLELGSLSMDEYVSLGLQILLDC